MNNLRIALVQMFSEKGAIDRNLVETARYIDAAEKRGIDIIAFPEASISGYSDRGKFPEAVVSRNGPEVAALLKLTEGKNLAVLAGIVERNQNEKPFITHLVVRNGRLLGYYRKMNIIEEDSDFATPGDKVKIFDHDGLTFGIAICSDIGMEKIFSECARMGAKIVFELAAPGLYGEQATRDWQAGYEWWEGECWSHFSVYAKKHNIWIGGATQAGRTVDEDFPGGGFLFSPKGERVYATKDWQPGVSYLEIDFDAGTVVELE